MRIAFFGDVVGRPGRQAVEDHLPGLKADLKIDFVVLNGENAAGGFGLTSSIASNFFDAGADCLTLGDHAWDQREMLTHIERDDRILRPLNYPKSAGAPGRGAFVYALPDGRRIGVVQVLCNTFMRQTLPCPFEAIDQAIEGMPMGLAVDALLIDVHGEATSERMAIGQYCDGRASLVVGSHTHVPTADHMVMPQGTAYQTDAGMCGDYDSVIGMKAETSIYRFRTQLPGERYQPALGEGTLCGTLVDCDPATGLAKRIAPIRVGGRLSQTLPDWS